MFNFKKYINLINEKRIDEAQKFKNDSIPKTMYKFISLNEPTNCNKLCKYDSISQMKINAIRENKFWLSTYENLNDPFELKSLYINEEKIKKYNYPIELVNELINSYKKILIGCFTTRFLDNLPMWAHYANNHMGICLEYEIINPEKIFPISYENERIQANVAIMNCLSLITKDIKGNITPKEKEDLNFYQSILFHNNLIKDTSWKYEDEYRLIYPRFFLPDHILKKDGGCLINTKMIGIKIKNIYLGLNCNEIYKTQLIDISKELGIGVYQVSFNNENTKYMLDYKEVK